LPTTQLYFHHDQVCLRTTFGSTPNGGKSLPPKFLIFKNAVASEPIESFDSIQAKCNFRFATARRRTYDYAEPFCITLFFGSYAEWFGITPLSVG
jgi:hypothetical protein